MGWKNLLLNEPVERGFSRTRVYWQSPEVGELFWLFHEIYISKIRPRTTLHPFYYVSLSPSTYGTPWTLGASKDFPPDRQQNGKSNKVILPRKVLSCLREVLRELLAMAYA